MSAPEAWATPMWAKVDPQAKRTHWFPANASISGCAQISRELGSWKDGRAERCKKCIKAAENASKVLAHDAYVARTYGVSRGFYARLIEAQDGYCAICQRANGRSKRLALDHDHSTGDPRGALCGPCNRILGFVRDDPEVLRRAARYLENPPAAALLLADNGEDAS